MILTGCTIPTKLRKIVSKNEYLAMGEEFEDEEHEFFGEDGVGTIVEKVANMRNNLESTNYRNLRHNCKNNLVINDKIS